MASILKRCSMQASRHNLRRDIAWRNWQPLGRWCIWWCYLFEVQKQRGEAMAIANPTHDAGAHAGGVKHLSAGRDCHQKYQWGLMIANVDSNQQVVLGGSNPQRSISEEQLKARKVFSGALPVAAAFSYPSLSGHAQGNRFFEICGSAAI